MDCKIIWCFFQLKLNFLETIKKFIHENLPECHMKVPKMHITLDGSFAQNWITDYSPYRVKINGNCLRKDSVSFLHKYVVNLYISYELDVWSKDLNTDFTLGNACLEL